MSHSRWIYASLGEYFQYTTCRFFINIWYSIMDQSWKEKKRRKRKMYFLLLNGKYSAGKGSLFKSKDCRQNACGEAKAFLLYVKMIFKRLWTTVCYSYRWESKLFASSYNGKHLLSHNFDNKVMLCCASIISPIYWCMSCQFFIRHFIKSIF